MRTEPTNEPWPPEEFKRRSQANRKQRLARRSRERQQVAPLRTDTRENENWQVLPVPLAATGG